MLQEVHDGIWMTQDPSFKFFGLFQIGTRMTVVKLPCEKLWVHSPVRLSDELKVALDQLGPVAHIVCPNQFHHLFAGEYAAAYPDAKVYGTQSLTKKRKDLSLEWVMGEGFASPEEWGEDLESLYIGGSAFEETVFLHRSSKTLITCDLLEYFTEHKGWFTRCYLKCVGSYKKPHFPSIVKTFYKDKPVAREAFETMLSWDFERMIISHGNVLVDDDPKGALRRTYHWLLE